MKNYKILVFLIVLVGVGFAQNDSTVSKKQAQETIYQKTVASNESAKSLNKIFPKNKTTWTKIKDLFM